ncbi:MAG: RagB/SusD family nutrient uptake outer membrane protein [Bacteroidales bacterium]|jgi:hypothetical protein|nr:RagB/SusD family nutrient uptake outer membrane protein [Bacteroidales bacterium]
MRIIRFNIIVFILICWTTSCSDFLEEDLSGIITNGSSSLNNEEGFFALLVGTYKPMSHTWESGYGNTHTMAVLMGSDDLTASKTRGSSMYRDFDMFMVNEHNFALIFIWRGAYKSIQGANNIIASYQNATGNQEAIKQIAGEAYFLRAYNYFWIVRLWGDAPLLLDSYMYSEGDLQIRKSPVSEKYAQIVDDLLMAEELLGNKKPQPGRVCKGTAKAILAEVYLHMAGWPIKETTYYKLAANKAKELVDNKDIYGFGLMENFAD